MKWINLIRCEFIKNNTPLKMLMISLVMLLAILVMEFFSPSSGDVTNTSIDPSFVPREMSDLEKEYQEYALEIHQEKMSLVKEKQLSRSSWQMEVLNDREKLLLEVFVLKQIKDNLSSSYFKEIKELDIFQLTHEYERTVKKYYTGDIEELERNIASCEKMLSDFSSLLSQNKYYKYLEYYLDSWNIEKRLLPYYQLLIEEKVEKEEDFRVLNLRQFSDLYLYWEHDFSKESIIQSEEKFYRSQLQYDYLNYDRYVQTKEKFLSLVQEQKDIVEYALKTNQKHDVEFVYESNLENSEYRYNTAKTSMNKVVHLSVVVTFLVALTSGGIISNEHLWGTDKNLLTSSCSRWKILCSKFLYLILHSYMIWAIGFVILLVVTTVRYGFSDLWTPKLIVSHESVVEVSYFGYLLKEILICSIPVIAFCAILLCLSTVTLSTAFTTGMMTMLAVLSPMLWYLISYYKIPSLAYTPFPYFDLGMVWNSSEYYLKTTWISNISLEYGILISCVTIFLSLGISSLVYAKRDIKN